MGLLEIDLPPIQLHASTQTDIRTPEARFLGRGLLSQIVLARELTLEQIRDRCRLDPARASILHPWRAVRAFSGQCYITRPHRAQRQSRGDCSRPAACPDQ